MYRDEVLERLRLEIFETPAYDWLITMAVTESQANQRQRDEQTRALLLRYIELLGPRGKRELTQDAERTRPPRARQLRRLPDRRLRRGRPVRRRRRLQRPAGAEPDLHRSP